MSTTTTRLALVKPDREDEYLVDSHYNPNLDTLDAATRYNQNETITGLWTFPNAGLKVKDVGGSYKTTLQIGSTLSADRTLNLATGDADRTITLSGNPTLGNWFDQAVKEASDVVFNTLKLTDMSVAGVVKNDVLGNLSGGNGIAQSDIVIDADWDVGAYEFRAKKLIGDDSGGYQLLLIHTESIDYAEFTVDSDGNLTISPSGGKVITPKIVGGIGTTSDLYFQTTSGVGASGADMHFLVGNNGATEALTILNSGNVGININNPSSKLHVYNGYGIIDAGASPNATNRCLRLTSTIGAGTWPGFAIQRGAVGEGAELYCIVAGSDYSLWQVRDTNGANPVGAFAVHDSGGLAIGSGYYSTDPGVNNVIVEGSLGLGTIGPDRKLDILDASNPQLRLTQANESKYADFQTDSNGYLILTPSGSVVRLPASNYLSFGATGGESGYGIRDNAGTMEYKNSGGSWANLGAGAGGDNIAELDSRVEVIDTGAGYILLQVDNSEIARIDATGLGIFNTSPAYALDVTGDIASTGYILVDGNEADGKFLRCYAGGVAAWASLPGGGTPTYSIGTFTNSDDTPDVSSNTSWRTATTGTTIIDFDGGTDGMEFSLIFTNATTIIQHNANIILQGGLDFNGDTGDTLRFVCDSGVWYELGGRSIK